MAWYAAHAIFYFKLKSGVQDCFSIHEDVNLIEAANGDEARQKAVAWANDTADANNEGSTLRVNDEPAEMIFAGIRKIISVSHWDEEGQLRSKDEITYSEFQVADEESVLKLARGETVTIDYLE